MTEILKLVNQIKRQLSNDGHRILGCIPVGIIDKLICYQNIFFKHISLFCFHPSKPLNLQ